MRYRLCPIITSSMPTLSKPWLVLLLFVQFAVVGILLSAILNEAHPLEKTASSSTSEDDSNVTSSGNQCRPRCPPLVCAETLQECIDLCKSKKGHCCGNRLDPENPDPFTGNNLLSCANGCEIAFYSSDVEDCKKTCNTGQKKEGKILPVANGLTLVFSKGKECREDPEECPFPESKDDCLDGCILASKLPEFYPAAPDADHLLCDEAPAPAIPRFLFAGQSNMEGYSNQALEGLFFETIQIVNEKFETPLDDNETTPSKRDRKIKKKLRNAIKRADGARKGSTKYEAKQLYKLAGDEKSSSLLNNETIFDPHPDIMCAYHNPKQSSSIGCDRPVSPTACGANGRNFGPELIFAHAFPTLTTPYSGTKFGITKVAPPGTKIDEFRKDSESERNFWWSLRDNIRADGGTIEAFFWFQGEGDEYSPMTGEEYLGKLILLARDVRKEIFDAHRARWGKKGSPTARFRSEEDIPVVICELGSWIGNNKGENGSKKIIAAQRKYVNEIDQNSILVNTGTHDNPEKRLSGFYHFDAPSQLIIGFRLAHAFKRLLKQGT